MPPYLYWQQNPAVGRIPPNRTDTGAYLVSEVFGARSMIYVKDEDGLYTADPKKDPAATLFSEISYRDVMLKELGVMDQTAIALCRENKLPVIVLNINTPGAIARAVKGERIGTIVQ